MKLQVRGWSLGLAFVFGLGLAPAWAGSTDPERLEQSFRTLIDSPNPETRLLNYLDRVKSIYFRAQAGVERFDADLAANLRLPESERQDLFQTENYQHLQILRALGEQTREKIIHHYLRLREIRTSRAESRERVALAQRVLLAFHQSLKRATEVERVAADDLVRELADAVRESATPADPTLSPLEPFPSVERAADAFRRTRRAMRIRAREESRELKLLESDIRSAAPVMRVAPPASQPSKYEPSMGPQGNITGSGFPNGVWALTYDDGPSSRYTPRVLANLQRLEKKATFFWLAQNVNSLPGIVRSALDLDMPLNNHSYSHADLTRQGADGIAHEIADSTHLETEIYGVKPRFFRCPYGAGFANTPIRRVIVEQGMIHVFWNVDTLDWQDKDPASILARAQKQMAQNKRGVILFHDIHPQSVEASRMLLEWSDTLRGTAFAHRWVTLPEIVDELNAVPPPAPPSAYEIPPGYLPEATSIDFIFGH